MFHVGKSDNYFFEENLSLGDYLIGLAAKSPEGAEKAQRIIYHLNNKEFDLVAKELAAHRSPLDWGTTTGTRIWNSLINTGLVETKSEYLKGTQGPYSLFI